MGAFSYAQMVIIASMCAIVELSEQPLAKDLEMVMAFPATANYPTIQCLDELVYDTGVVFPVGADETNKALAFRTDQRFKFPNGMPIKPEGILWTNGVTNA